MSELTLTDRESRRLKQLEQNIVQAGSTMYDSLRAIHDEKLYRDKFPTWEAYCDERWRMSKSWAYRIIQHGRILALLNENSPDLSPIGDKSKTSPIGDIPESATRELKGLPDSKKVEVIEAVARESKSKNNGKPRVTAAAVKEKVKEIATKVILPKKAGGGTSPAKLVDELSKKHVSALVRGIDAVAEVNGGKGLAHVCANDALNDLIAALKRMRGGEK